MKEHNYINKSSNFTLCESRQICRGNPLQIAQFLLQMHNKRRFENDAQQLQIPNLQFCACFNNFRDIISYKIV